MLQSCLGLGVAAFIGCWINSSISQKRERERHERERLERQQLFREQQQREMEMALDDDDESESESEYQSRRLRIQRERRVQADAEARRQHQRREEQRRERQQQQQQELWSQLASEVDSFIRTRRKFDTSQPTQYSCRIDTIESELESRIEPSFDEWRKLVHAFAGTRFALSRDRQSVSVRHLTPFQGESSHRVFGYFRCACGKRWKSAGTWKDTWQKCKACETQVYPHEQHILERTGAEEDEGERRPHDMSRCQRCCEKGSLCMPRLYYAV